MLHSEHALTQMVIANSIVAAIYLSTTLGRAASVVIDFESLPLDANEFYNGSDDAGGFITLGTHFRNEYLPAFGAWRGWSYSRVNDTVTPGFENQYAAFPGSGAHGSAQYAVAFSGTDTGTDVAPLVTLPESAEPVRVKIANTTYAALSMLHGDDFARQFGGSNTMEPDWFLLIVEGWDENNQPVGEVPLYLADYRFADPDDDFILDEWSDVDLTALQGLGIRKLAIRLSSSDNSIFGMNTPAYVAWDDLELEVDATPGDFNLDTFVNGDDLAIWQHNFGTLPSGEASFENGDADEDGDVDGHDFLAWQQHFGSTTPSSSLSASESSLSVPEPTSQVMIVAMMLWGFAGRLLPQFCSNFTNCFCFSITIFAQEGKS